MLKPFLRALALVLFAMPLQVLACSGRLHIELENAGVYRLDHAQIVAAQPALADCASHDLLLTQNGKDVPIRVVAKSDRFGDGDHIEWIGRRLHGPESWYDPFSVNNVYVLGASSGQHARLRDVDALANGHATLERHLHLEQENLMIRLDQSQQKPGEESDVWQWAKMTQVDPQPFQTQFDLPDLDALSLPTAFTLDFRGLSDIAPPAKNKVEKPVDHRVELSINGHALAPLDWDGRDEIRRDVVVPTVWLKAKDNALVMRVPKRALPWDAAISAVDVVMFNWLGARYSIGGDLDASDLPLKVSGAATLPLQLTYRGDGIPALYGSDGVRRAGRSLGNGRYAFAPVSAGVDLFPVLGERFKTPVSMRAVIGDQWQHPGRGFDYLIVAHPRLIDAIRPLADFHEKRGLKVAVLDVDAVYDQFNHGITHPQAIRNLVDTAYYAWPKKPRFLLLVGDSSFDIRHDTYNDLNYAKWTDNELLYPGHFGAVPGTPYPNAPKKLADRNLIPTWQYPSPEGQSASDNAFATIDGGDWHPVVAVGRFPVVEPAEVTAIVDKTIDYLSKPQLGAWRRDVMFITDELDAFKQASNEIASALGKEGFLADKVYASPKETDNAAHQDAIREGIDDGRLIVHFIGHGGRYIWRTGPPDLRKNADLFTLDDVSSLKTSSRLPMVLSMTCYSAPFDNPTEDSIGERFLREPGKGAIAVFAASWRNSPSPAYSTRLMDELLKPGATIGEAIVRAKKVTQDRTLVEMYNLLGDPAVVLERPRDDAKVLFDASARWNPGVLVDLGPGRFEGNINVAWLDAKGNQLATSRYHSDAARFRLSVPVLATGKVTAVRLYAASPTSGRDSVGGLDFDNIKPPAPARSVLAAISERWREFTRPPYTPPVWHADTISILDFDAPPMNSATTAGTSSTDEDKAIVRHAD